MTRTLRDHEERLRNHDGILRNKTVDITSLQHQLFAVLSRERARDEVIKTMQQTMSNTSFSEVSYWRVE